MKYIDSLTHIAYTIPDDLLADYVLPRLDKKYFMPVNTHVIYFPKSSFGIKDLARCKYCNLHLFFRVKEDDRCYCRGCNGIVEYCICLEKFKIENKRKEIIINYVAAEKEKALAAKAAINEKNSLRLSKLGKIGSTYSDKPIILEPLPIEIDTPADVTLHTSYLDSVSSTGTIFTDYLSYESNTVTLLHNKV